MARYRGSVCRLCRRESLKLFLKGERCYTDKCAVDRRNYPPGQHGPIRRIKNTDYGIQLREKQKVKRMYGILENQFRRYFEMAERKKGITGTNLLVFLERRLDNVVYRLGFCSSRNEARQFVRHGHILVNGKRVDVPFYMVSPGEDIKVMESSRKIARIQDSLESVDRRGIPGWLELDKSSFSGLMKNLPARDDITMPIQEQLIVELYSR